mmetsp:Transcript_10179/g.20736  ORF Transcript_10179/g.20736 Transcript_10179/m.20736 type:complete len:253 (-) Transcript_10179:401-1159(-)
MDRPHSTTQSIVSQAIDAWFTFTESNVGVRTCARSMIQVAVQAISHAFCSCCGAMTPAPSSISRRSASACASASSSQWLERARKEGCSHAGAPRPFAAHAAWFHPPMSWRCSSVSRRRLRASSGASVYVACSSRLVAAAASGERCAICAARSRAASKGDSESRVTRPSLRASAPSKMRPVRVSSIATSLGTSSGRVTVADISGMMPHLDSMTDSLAVGEQMRMSAPSATCRPPPKQTPCTAAITGAGTRRHR